MTNADFFRKKDFGFCEQRGDEFHDRLAGDDVIRIRRQK
jgi:hypothetical protein